MGDPEDIIVETLKEGGKNAQEGYVLVNKDHQIVWINPYLEGKGYNLEHIKGQLYCKVFEGRETLDEACSTVKALKTGQSYQKYTKGKDKKLYLIKSQPIKVEGETKYVLEISKEVPTPQKAITRETKPMPNTGLPLNLVVKHCFDAIFIADEKKNYVYVNTAYEKLTGYSYVELAGRTPSIFQKPPDGQGVYHQFKHAMDSGEVWTEKSQRRRKEGSPYWVETKIIPLKNNAGVVTHYLGIQKDITHEQDLIKEIDRYKSFPNSNTNPVVQTNYEGEFTFLAKKTKSRFAEKGSNISGILGPKIKMIIAHMKGKGEAKILNREVKLNGKLYQVSMVDVPRLERINFYFSDITKIKEAEKELRYKNEDLEKFYKVGVGRELKMIELKKKLKELEKKIQGGSVDGAKH